MDLFRLTDCSGVRLHDERREEHSHPHTHLKIISRLLLVVLVLVLYEESRESSRTDHGTLGFIYQITTTNSYNSCRNKRRVYD